MVISMGKEEIVASEKIREHFLIGKVIKSVNIE